MFRVLIPVENDEQHGMNAAKVAADLPDAASNIEVTILNVQPELNRTGGGVETIDPEERYDEDEYPEAVHEVEQFLLDTGISVNRIRRHGDPTEEILSVAEEIEADRIIFGGTRRSPAGKVIFGSVIQSVLLDSSIPITVTLE